ncbi:MAG: hypothetical protein M1536_09435 [Firmicutes bacterium]|nr:hypothetical protein [Bacillota bacterium]
MRTLDNTENRGLHFVKYGEVRKLITKDGSEIEIRGNGTIKPLFLNKIAEQGLDKEKLIYDIKHPALQNLLSTQDRIDELMNRTSYPVLLNELGEGWVAEREEEKILVGCGACVKEKLKMYNSEICKAYDNKEGIKLFILPPRITIEKFENGTGYKVRLETFMEDEIGAGIGNGIGQQVIARTDKDGKINESTIEEWVIY